MAEWVLLVLSLALVVTCGVFVAGEFALLTADRASVRRAADGGDRKAQGVMKAFAGLSTELAGVQVAITLTNLAIGFLSEPALAALLHGPLRAVGVSGAAVDAVAVTVALIVSTVLTMVFGELVPKNLAIAKPVATARAVQAPLRAFTRAMRLPIRLFDGFAGAVLTIFGLHAQEELASARTPDELLSLVRHSQRQGTLAPGTATLLVRSLTFDDKRARDVLTARPRMVTVGRDASVTELLAAVRSSGRSRLPVTGPGGIDDIVGIVELDQAVAVPVGDRDRVRVGDVMAGVVEVPETLTLYGVLRTLQRARSQLAVVVDEYGGTAGLLTGEDLLEELVGELDDEHDTPAPPVRRVAEGFEVSGLLRPDEVTAATGYELPSRGVYETAGGLIMQALGRVPVEGDELVVGSSRLRVLRMDGRRVDLLLVGRHVPEAGGA